MSTPAEPVKASLLGWFAAASSDGLGKGTVTRKGEKPEQEQGGQSSGLGGLGREYVRSFPWTQAPPENCVPAKELVKFRLPGMRKIADKDERKTGLALDAVRVSVGRKRGQRSGQDVACFEAITEHDTSPQDIDVTCNMLH